MALGLGGDWCLHKFLSPMRYKSTPTACEPACVNDFQLECRTCMSLTPSPTELSEPGPYVGKLKAQSSQSAIPPGRQSGSDDLRRHGPGVESPGRPTSLCVRVGPAVSTWASAVSTCSSASGDKSRRATSRARRGRAAAPRSGCGAAVRLHERIAAVGLLGGDGGAPSCRGTGRTRVAAECASRRRPWRGWTCRGTSPHAVAASLTSSKAECTMASRRDVARPAATVARCLLPRNIACTRVALLTAPGDARPWSARRPLAGPRAAAVVVDLVEARPCWRFSDGGLR